MEPCKYFINKYRTGGNGLWNPWCYEAELSTPFSVGGKRYSTAESFFIDSLAKELATHPYIKTALFFPGQLKEGPRVSMVDCSFPGKRKIALTQWGQTNDNELGQLAEIISRYLLSQESTT